MNTPGPYQYLGPSQPKPKSIPLLLIKTDGVKCESQPLTLLLLLPRQNTQPPKPALPTFMSPTSTLHHPTSLPIPLTSQSQLPTILLPPHPYNTNTNPRSAEVKKQGQVKGYEMFPKLHRQAKSRDKGYKKDKREEKAPWFKSSSFFIFISISSCNCKPGMAS